MSGLKPGGLGSPPPRPTVRSPAPSPSRRDANLASYFINPMPGTYPTASTPPPPSSRAAPPPPPGLFQALQRRIVPTPTSSRSPPPPPPATAGMGYIPLKPRPTNEPPDPNAPIFVAIFGKTGTGKTSFIQSVTGREMVVGHSLESSTKEVMAFPWEVEGRQVMLVDTPGFDDTNLTDTEILKIIATWLTDWYDDRVLLSGIIYLHRITDIRMDPASKKSLRMFKSMCGPDGLKNVILTTTMWENTEESDGVRREAELKDVYWKEMISQGSEVTRISNTPEDAKRLVRRFLKNEPMVLQLQDELSNQGKKLIQTEAGVDIREEIERLKLKYQKEFEDAKKELEEALKRRDKELQKDLRHEIEEVKGKLNMLESENQTLIAMKPSLLPKNRRHSWWQHQWICVRCSHKTSKQGEYKCKKCGTQQRNIFY